MDRNIDKDKDKNEEYQALVLGSEPGGYFLALSLLRQGLRVKILEPSSHAFFSGQHKKISSLEESAWEPILGFSTAAPEEEFLRNLGLYKNFSSLFYSPRVALQVISPRKRINCSYPFHLMNWEEEYPEKKDKILNLWGNFQASNPSSKASFLSMVRKHDLDEEWMSWGASQLFLYGSTLDSSIPLAPIRRYSQLAENGMHFLKGGKEFFRELLLHVLSEHGVVPEKIHTNSISILEKKGVLCGVAIGERKIFTPWLVGAMGAEDFLSYIPKRYHFTPIMEQSEKRHPKAFRFCFSISLPKECLPEALGSHFCFHDPKESRLEDHFFQVLQSSFLYRELDPKKELLQLRIIVPYSPESLEKDFLLKAAKRAIHRLQEIFPFMKSISSLKLNPPSSLKDIAREQILYEYDNGVESFWDWDWENYGLSSFALCARDSDQGMGFLGEVRSAMELSKKILESQKNRK